MLFMETEICLRVKVYIACTSVDIIIVTNTDHVIVNVITSSCIKVLTISLGQR